MPYVGTPKIGVMTGCRKDYMSLSNAVGIVEVAGRCECCRGVNVAVTTDISPFN